MTTKQNFLDAKEVGYILSHEDNDTIFHIARNQFLEENTVAKKQSDRIYDEFYQRFIY